MKKPGNDDRRLRAPEWLTGYTPGKWFEAYRNYLTGIEAAFEAARAVHPSPNPCKPGCGACCRGIFNISLADAVLLWKGLDALAAANAAAIFDITKRAAALDAMVTPVHGGFRLFYPPAADDALDALCEAPAPSVVPCPVLDPVTQSCRLYAHRPLTCRMGGMLFENENGDRHFDKCPIRPDGAETPEPAAPYDESLLFYIEGELCREVTASAGGRGNRSVDRYETTIPSVIAAWDRARRERASR